MDEFCSLEQRYPSGQDLVTRQHYCGRLRVILVLSDEADDTREVVLAVTVCDGTCFPCGMLLHCDSSTDYCCNVEVTVKGYQRESKV